MPLVLFPKIFRHFTILAVLIVLAALLAACRNTDDAEGPQVLSTLPGNWTPLTGGGSGWFGRTGSTAWRQINIDNDLIPEYLLYFAFDNGQVGAIIYDQQTGGSGGITSPAAPNQPAGQYVSYQVEPSFWMRSDVPDTVGFIAPPATPVEQLRIEQVERFPAGTANQAGTANPNPGESVPTTNEVIIYGGQTVISVLWWRNTTNGYGIAQMQAAGGKLIPRARTQGDVLRPLEQVTGQTPRTDLPARSVLCDETRFTRTDANEPADIVQPIYQSAVYYQTSEGGIVFCNGAPEFPYYPEGVVLAYLRSAPAGATEAAAPPSQLLWSGLNSARQTALAAMVDLNGPGVAGAPPLLVRDLRTRPNIPLPADMSSAGGTLTTNVCAEVVTEDGQTLRRLLFDLVYEPVQTSGTTILPERFSIANITDITDVFVNCALLIP